MWASWSSSTMILRRSTPTLDTFVLALWAIIEVRWLDAALHIVVLLHLYKIVVCCQAAD